MVVMTPPPFGSPATYSAKEQALRLCAPTSRRVCPYRGAGAPAHVKNRTNPEAEGTSATWPLISNEASYFICQVAISEHELLLDISHMRLGRVVC